MTRAWGWDDTLVATAAMLMACGIAMVYSTSSITSLGRFGDAEHYLWHQAVYATIALGVLVTVAAMPLEQIRKLAYPAIGLAVLLLALVLVPGIGEKVGGARRWLPLGPVKFQPSEFAKVAAVLYLAHSLAKKEEAVATFRVGILSHFAVLGVVAGLIFVEPDLGTCVILGVVSMVLLFVGGVRPSALVAIGVGALPFALAYLVRIKGNSYQWDRIEAWWRPWEHARDSGFQLIQSLLAFTSGGWTGRGIGAGKQKMYFLPEAHTDFIFAVTAEEWGILGTALVLGAFATVLAAGTGVARRAGDRFAMLLALGLSSLIVLQALVNVSVTVGLLPTKGLVLPFMSYGGSALVANALAMGMLVAVARAYRGRA